MANYCYLYRLELLCGSIKRRVEEVIDVDATTDKEASVKARGKAFKIYEGERDKFAKENGLNWVQSNSVLFREICRIP